MSETNPQTSHPVLVILQEATQDLLFLSETDAPIVPFFWPDENNTAPLTPERLCELSGESPDAPIKIVSLAAFFRSAAKEEDWHNEEESAEVKRFQSLVETLKTMLKKPTVFRMGEINMAVYVAGAVDGGWAGVQTRIVET